MWSPGSGGVQLQNAGLPAHIKPMEAVGLFARWNRVKPDRAVLSALGIPEMAKRQYGELSTGQKRRLHLALALIGDPDILFLDEPTAGLDVEGRAALHEEIRRLKARGKTIVLASHDMAEVEALCDRIAVLSGGQILFTGTVEELTQRTGKQYTVCVQTSRGKEVFVSSDVGETLLTKLQEYKKNGITVLDIQVSRGSLEEHFIKITQGGKPA